MQRISFHFCFEGNNTWVSSFLINLAHNMCKYWHHSLSSSDGKVSHKILKSLWPQAHAENWNLYFLSFHKTMTVQCKLNCFSATELHRACSKGNRTTKPSSLGNMEGTSMQSVFTDGAFQSSVGSEKQPSFRWEISLLVTNHFLFKFMFYF